MRKPLPSRTKVLELLGSEDRAFHANEIATILGISPETVHQHVKQARANYDAVSPSQLVAHALFSGTISFMDIFKR